MYRLTKESFFEYDEGACADLGGGGVEGRGPDIMKLWGIMHNCRKGGSHLIKPVGFYIRFSLLTTDNDPVIILKNDFLFLR